MRIALVSQEYPPDTAKGGLGSQTHLKAHGLVGHGHEVYVVSRTAENALRETHDGPVNVIRAPDFCGRMQIQNPIVDWLTHSATIAAVVNDLHARRPLDLIDFPEWGAEGYVHLLNQAEDNHIPTVVQLHSPLVMFGHTMGWPEIDSEFFRIGTDMEQTCLRLADGVFSSSKCSIEWCRKYYDLVFDDIPVIHTGVDTEVFSPRPSLSKEKCPTIIFVGRLVRNKGVEELLQACCKLAFEFPTLQLRMLGRGEAGLIRELKEKSAAEGLASLLDLRGFVPHEELADQLCSADVFAAPSLYEGGPGMVYLEAMACGLPVVACDGSGITEVITHGDTGLLIPPQNVEALTAALRSLLADPAGREAMGARARDFVVKKLDSKLCLERLGAFYLAVVERARKRT